MLDKVTLRGQLQTVKNNYALAQFGIALMAEEGALDRFKAIVEMLDGHTELNSITYITYLFESDALVKHATQQFRGSVLRNCLKEMFELVKTYGEKTKQTQAVEKAEWYQFLRMIRNCLSHDMLLDFRPGDLKRLPVKWAGITIDASMQGQALPPTLTRSKSFDLIESVITYAENHVD